VLFAAMVLWISPFYWLGYFIFFSALIICLRTDLETMLLSRYTTLLPIPCAWLLSIWGFLPINFLNSLLSGLFGFVFLWTISRIFFVITKREGIGEGDFDLLCLIGSFTGFYAMWSALMIGSILGSIIGVIAIVSGKHKQQNPLPFGPFLIAGSIISVFFYPQICALLYW
jgi:leader peptidase (prepilin peptidase)/N-methyltransferase